MDDPTKPAEHVSHDLTRSTISAIPWTGGLSIFLAAITLLWTFWRFRSDREEKDAKERKEKKDEKRRKIADEEDAERMGMADKWDEGRWKRMEEAAEKRMNAAAKQLEEQVKYIRDDHYQLRLDLDRAIVNSTELLDLTKKRHEVLIAAEKMEITALQHQVNEMRRQMRSSLGRQPGGAGVTQAATGG